MRDCNPKFVSYTSRFYSCRTAAGNGLASGDNTGVAPKSDIIMVKSDFSKPNWFATVVDAVDYIFSVADYYGKPCVINASVGGYFGSHDGLDVEALMIDDLINEKPGRLLVCAGGNSGLLAPYHVRNEVNADTTFTWFTINPSSAFGFPAGYIIIWADKDKFDDVHFAIGADKISPNFEFRGRTDFKNVIADNMVDAMTTDVIEVGGNTLANIEYYITEDNNRYEIIVYIPQPDSANYYYRFMATTQTNGTYDIWASSVFGVSSLIKDGLPSVSDFPDIQYYIAPDTLQSIVTSWACSPSVITVANYNSVDRYTDYNGDTQMIGDIPRELNLTSSKGPTRLGLIKPDIGATGATTFSASVVSDVIARRASNPTTLHKSGWHLSNGGTSMASPVVAGVGALLLQRCPNLTPQKFKEIITSTAFKDAYTGSSLPDNAWGYGKVDAFAAVVSTLLPKPSITVVGTSLMASMALAYQWYKDGEPINGETSQILNDFDVDADYMVEIFNEFGCSSFSDPSSGLGVLVVGKDFKLYPNPTNDLINIDFDLSTNPKSLTIVDVLGRELKTINTLKLTNTIDVSDLDAGVYFMLIKNQNEQLSKVSFIKH
jgi:subtilisin family serine protease